MKLLILLAIIFAVNAEDNFDGEECKWGPSFWCTSVKSAKNCGAVNFCIRNTWSQSSFVQGIHDDNTCTACKKLVDDVRDLITSDDAEHKIVAFADNACAQLKSKFIVDECKGIVNLYIVQIIQMLRQNMDATAVCHAVSLCASKDMFTAPTNYRPYFAISQQALTELAVEKLQAAEIAPTFAALAAHTARTTKGLSETPLRSFVGTQSDQCNTCKEGVHDLKIVFANAGVQQDISQILKSNICTRFVLPAECNKLIDEYAPEIYQTIINLDPEAACETIGMCNTIASNFPNLELERSHPLRLPKASAGCILCEYAISSIFQALENNKTEENVIQIVTNVCNILPSSIKNECDQFIEQYGEELIDLITHSADPQTICATIGLCGNSVQQIENDEDVNMFESVRPFLNMGPVLNGFGDNDYKKPIKNSNPKLDASNKCFMCRIVANYLIALLNENATALVIENGLDKVCGILPNTYTKECDMFVDQYTTQVMQALMASLNTQVICESLDMCPKTVMPGNNQFFNAKAEEELEVAPFGY